MEQSRERELFQATGWLLGPWCLPRDISAEPLSIFLPRRKQSLVPSSEVKPCARVQRQNNPGALGLGHSPSRKEKRFTAFGDHVLSNYPKDLCPARPVALCCHVHRKETT